MVRSFLKRSLHLALGLTAGLVFSASAQAESRVLCAYDPGGKSGDYYAILEDFSIWAGAQGVDLTVRAYTDEETATKDYEAGQCDGVVATGVRLQRFNRFPSTIEAIGALPDYALLQQMVNTLANYESAAKKLRSGDHETIGFLPAGAVYLFVRDRSKDTTGELAGIRIATMDYDKASMVMVDRVGSIVVPADLGSIGPKFNNGDVDACYVSAPAFRPFELWRGLDAAGGGILRAPLAQATLQVMIRPSRFPESFPAAARKDLAGRFDTALALVKKAEADIPSKYWVDIPADRLGEWEELFQAVRLKLRDDVGAYDGMMLGVMRKLRCSADASRSECAEQKE